jgi:hypothetical protein
LKVTEINESKIYLVTFGSGKAWKPAVARLRSQAKKSGRFGKVISFSEIDLDTEIMGIPSEFFSKNSRGFGLWIWKPYIVQKVLREFPECEIVFYLDAGCELNNNMRALEKLDHYIRVAKDNGCLAFEIPFLEKNWTAEFVLSQMSAEDLSETKQLAGGIFFLTNCVESSGFLSLWQNWMTRDDSIYLKGNRHLLESSRNFKEHRFDQSIFSILWKQNRWKVLPDESFWHPDWKENGESYPIWATRSRLRFSFASNIAFLFMYRLARFSLTKISKGSIQI